ncbi:MAG: DsbA family protein [Terriglobia bacterium]
MSKQHEGMSRRELRRENRRRAGQRNRLITIGVVVLVAALAAFVLIYPNLRPVGDIVTPEPFERPQAQAHTLGDPNAPIKIEEFADFQCPFCRRFYEDTERELIETYVATGKVYFVFRSFGEFIGAESRAAAEAAYCAGDQDKFWEMYDYIFANQTGENVGAYTHRRLVAFAETIGLEMDEFRSCFNGGKYSDQVDQDFLDGRTAGVTATPSFLMTYTVNGETKSSLIQGAQPFSEFQTQIEAALAEMGVE